MSITKRMMVFLTGWLAVNQFLALVTYWLGVTLNKEIIWTTWGIWLLVWLIKGGLKGKILDRSDWLPLGLVVITIWSFVPSLWSYNHSLRIPIISHGVDAAAHFGMFSKMVEVKKLLYGGGHFDNFPQLAGWTFYPSGFYGNAAVFYLGLISSVGLTDMVYRATFFSIFSILIYGLLVYWLGVLSEFFLKSSGSFLKRLTVFFGLIFLIEGQIFELYNFGFVPQILSYLWVLFLVWLTINRKLIEDKKYWLGLLIVNLCIVHSWYVVSLVSAAWLFWECVINKFYRKWWFWLLSLIFVYPTVFPVLSSTSYLGAKAVMTGGGVFVINSALLIFLTLINILGGKSGDRILFRAMIISIGYALIVGGYQIILGGGVNYFFYKSLYLVLIFLSLGVIQIWGEMKVLVSVDNSKTWLLGLWVIFMLVVAGKANNGEGSSFFTKREPFLDQEIYNGLVVIKESGLDKKYEIVPFGTFKNIIWFYAFMGYLPDFYKNIFPQVEFKQYPWIFDQIKGLKLEKPLLIFDAFTVTRDFDLSQKGYLKANKIKVYPEGAMK